MSRKPRSGRVCVALLCPGPSLCGRDTKQPLRWCRRGMHSGGRWSAEALAPPALGAVSSESLGAWVGLLQAWGTRARGSGDRVSLGGTSWRQAELPSCAGSPGPALLPERRRNSAEACARPPGSWCSDRQNKENSELWGGARKARSTAAALLLAQAAQSTCGARAVPQRGVVSFLPDRQPQ